MKKAILAAAAMACGAAAGAVAFWGETSNREVSMFRAGDEVRVKFWASGLGEGEGAVAEVTVKDHRDEVVKRERVELRSEGGGKAAGEWVAPGGRLGFYRVHAELGDGTKLRKEGSRAEGVMTYGVVADPEKRKLLPPEETYFGGHGFMVETLPWLGIRWSPGANVMSPEKYAEALEWRKKARRKGCVEGWVTYNWSNHQGLYAERKKTGDLEKFREAWRNLGKWGKEQPPRGGVRLFQPMWEPDLFSTDEDILECHREAYRAVKEADPEAVVVGPTFSTVTDGAVKRMGRLFARGLLESVDEVMVHPYFGMPVERGGLVRCARELVGMVEKFGGGRKLAVRGNEAGFAYNNTPGQEAVQAMGYVRGGLILLGEGFASNEAFYGYDHGDGKGGDDYGLFYNLQLPARRWGPELMSPRPAAVAYAVMSWVCEGHRPVRPLNMFGDRTWGYLLRDRGGHEVAAIWDWTGGERELELPVGEREVTVTGMYGEERRVRAAGGKVKVRVSGEVTYVGGLDGRALPRGVAGHYLEREEERSPLEVEGAARESGGGWRVTLGNRSAREVEGEVRVRVMGYGTGKAVRVKAGAMGKVGVEVRAPGVEGHDTWAPLRAEARVRVGGKEWREEFLLPLARVGERKETWELLPEEPGASGRVGLERTARGVRVEVELAEAVGEERKLAVGLAKAIGGGGTANSYADEVNLKSARKELPIAAGERRGAVEFGWEEIGYGEAPAGRVVWFGVEGCGVRAYRVKGDFPAGLGPVEVR